jgi:hypothetical protein
MPSELSTGQARRSSQDFDARVMSCALMIVVTSCPGDVTFFLVPIVVLLIGKPLIDTNAAEPPTIADLDAGYLSRRRL